jgi:uncharacterized secreted protein with C-terminal beta-propeller domain
MRTDTMSMKEAWPTQWKLIVLVTLVVWILVACGGGGGTALPPVAIQPDPIADGDQSKAQLTASKPGDLTQYVRNKLISNPVSFGGAISPVAMGAVARETDSTFGSLANGIAYAGTTVQEQGVDEADWVKTDGSQLYALRREGYDNSALSRGTVTAARLTAQLRLSDGQLSEERSLELKGRINVSGMYLSTQAQNLAVLSQDINASLAIGRADGLVPSEPFREPYQVVLDIVPTQTTTTLSIAQTLKIDGQLVGSRLIGKHLYLVTQWSPNLSAYYQTTPQGTTINTARLGSLTYAEILPKIQKGAQLPQPLLAETDCYVQDKNAAPDIQLTSITAIDLSTVDLKRESKCFAGGASALYMSEKSIYLSSSRYYSYPTDNSFPVFSGQQSTDIHKFSLGGSTVVYKGSGEVPGHLGWDPAKASYRMSEYQDDLRVVSYTGQTGLWGGFLPMPAITSASSGTTTTATPTSVAAPIGTSPPASSPTSPATLSILREAPNQKLAIVGSLPNAQQPQPIGKPGEQVYAVKFIGPRAYVVTFRRTDPLYVLDLSNPAQPKTLGELQLPGFSDYLYPMSDALLLGVGKDANDTGAISGIKLALINVSNPAAPVVNSQIIVGKAGSSSALDFSPQGISIFAQNGVQRIALPIRVHGGSNTNNTFNNKPLSQGLYRFEVSTNAPAAQAQLITKPVVGEVLFDPIAPYGDPNFTNRYLGNERSIQIEADIYYFNAGKFLRAVW